jgi:hypothetical protein
VLPTFLFAQSILPEHRHDEVTAPCATHEVHAHTHTHLHTHALLSFCDGLVGRSMNRCFAGAIELESKALQVPQDRRRIRVPSSGCTKDSRTSNRPVHLAGYPGLSLGPGTGCVPCSTAFRFGTHVVLRSAIHHYNAGGINQVQVRGNATRRLASRQTCKHRD